MRTAAFLLAVLAFTAVGCSPRMAPPTPGNVGTVPPGDGGVTLPGDGPDDLARARARWQAADIDSYAYTIQRNCFCTEEYRGPFDVTAQNDRITSIKRNGQTVAGNPAEVPTVDELFRLLAEAYAQGAAEVRVTYDTARGYPTEIWIDRNEQIADEEVGYTVTGLSPSNG